MPDLNEQENKDEKQSKGNVIDNAERIKNTVSTKKDKGNASKKIVSKKSQKHRGKIVVRKRQTVEAKSKQAKIRRIIKKQRSKKDATQNASKSASSPIKRTQTLKPKRHSQKVLQQKKNVRTFRRLNRNLTKVGNSQQQKFNKYQSQIRKKEKILTRKELKATTASTQSIRRKQDRKDRLLINKKKKTDGHQLLLKKTTVQTTHQKQNQKKQGLVNKKQKKEIQKSVLNKQVKQNEQAKKKRITKKRQQKKAERQATTNKKNRLFAHLKYNKNQKFAQKNERKSGKKKTYKKKNLKQKFSKQVHRNVSPKSYGKNAVKEMIIDKIGRDDKGDLTILGFILTILLLVPFLAVLKIIAILAVILAIIAVIIAIFSFILGLFVVKTESMMITQAYEYVTWLDAHKNKEVYEQYNKLVQDNEHDEVYFEVNGVASDPDKFTLVSNGDSYIYYLNAKYEEYDIDDRATNVYVKRLTEATGIGIPSTGIAHVSFKDSPHPMTDDPIKINRVKHEIHAIHDMTYSYSTVIEKDKEVETTTVTIDKETGKETIETTTERKDIATVKVEIQTLNEMLDMKPEVEVYGYKVGILEADDNYTLLGTVEAFDEAENDKYGPIMERERLESKIFMNNPLGRDTYSPVVENYGYRGKDDEKMNIEIMLDAEPGSPVYAMTDEEVDGVNRPYTAQDSNGNMVSTNSIKTDTGPYYAYYINVTPIVRVGDDLKAGDIIGYTKEQFDGNLLIAIEEYIFLHSDPDIYPAIYIDNLIFANDTNLGYINSSGGLRGDLMNPPEKVVQWRQKVSEEAQKNNIASYTNTLLSIIWVESGGDGETVSDIMGVEKATGKKLGITHPEQSIELGVAYFAELLRKAQANQTGDMAALQAYNYGEEYLDDLIRMRGKYSLDHTRIYAKEKSNGETVPYTNVTASNLGYNWRYTYGDMFYAKLITHNIKANSGELIEIAKKEIGTPNGDKYWQWGGFANRIEWSAIFVSWVAEQAGFLDQGRVLKTASSMDMMKWYQTNQKFQAADDAYMPQSGDIVFFDWSGKKTGKDQVGIVEYSGGNIVQVIEGNSNNLVRRRTYALDNIAISGYGIP